MKIVTVAGARPQFIKAAIVSRGLRQIGCVNEVFVHTGQHYDHNMSDVFFDELEMSPPDYHLGIGGGTHGVQTGLMLQAMDEVLLREKPDRVLVYGDTNSTLAGALASVKLHIPVAHVEAGLRSFNRRMPEEINRILTDHVADLLFAPTEAAMAHLRNEGIGAGKAHLVGDVMYDAALHFGAKAQRASCILDQLGLRPGEYILATVHRAESTDDAEILRAIVTGLVAAGPVVVLPLHPRTRKALERIGLLEDVAAKVRLIEPVGYLDMLSLERNARLIATDSGGVQKEAFFCRVPCVTLRTETEWTELVEAGWNTVVPPCSADAIIEGVKARLDSHGREVDLYGNGRATQRITSILAEKEA